jgi:Response regulators consisting of a CheY-like receiver domain and a winged-helix DNA-binding domain
MSQFDRPLELGKLYCDRGDYALAVDYLREAGEGFFVEKDFKQYFKATNLLMRAYADTDQFDKINVLKEKIQDLILNEGLELSSKTYYILAMCTQMKGQTEGALDYFQKALTLALAVDDKEDICRAIFGIARCYASPELGRYADALKEIYNLQVFFQVYDFPEIKFSSLWLNAEVLRRLKKYDEAIEVAWKAYDELKNTKNLIMGTNLLGLLGTIYLDAGDKDMARMYLTLANRSVDQKNSSRLAKMIRNDLEKVGGESEQNFDLIFDDINHTVYEKKIGKVDFKNQFILLDLLRLFVQNQGKVYSKEFLVENVWKQPYDPVVHDNKIYVTIKRLRKMIEPDYEKPKYIFRAKNGYYMNKSARVHVGQH